MCVVSRALTGPEGARGPTKGGGEGGGKARRERSKPQQPQTRRAKTSKATKQETQNSSNKRKEPRSTPKGEPQGKHRGQRTPDTKGQPEQAVADERPRDTVPSTQPKTGRRRGTKYPREKRPDNHRERRPRETRS